MAEIQRQYALFGSLPLRPDQGRAQDRGYGFSFKKLLGIYFGPANFYSDEQHFLITPLEKLPKKAGKS